MKKIKFILFAVLLAVVAAGAISCGKNSGRETAGASEAKTLYTCGMHPQIIQDHPGNCPICGMKLTPDPQAGRQRQHRRGFVHHCH